MQRDRWAKTSRKIQRGREKARERYREIEME